MPSETTSPSFSCSEAALKRLRELADQPIVLVLVLLAANALARPYAGFLQDARLYTAQVLNHVEHGIYDNDLFFRFGSQDQYSAFSRFMAPLVSLLGLQLAFFVGYLASNFLFIAALVALMPLLVKDRLLALVAMFYVAIQPLEYCTNHVFYVQEPFLTPRLPAAGLVLFGLAKLLQGRLAASFVLMVLAGLMHPLIATGGFLIWGGVAMVEKLGWRWTLSALAIAVVAVTAFLATPTVAGRWLGDMDATWRDTVLSCTPFVFMSEWELRDWGNVLFSFVCIAGGVWILCFPAQTLTPSWEKDDHRRAAFVIVTGLVGIAAVLGTLLVEHLPYALPFQGQPYRALWILKVLQAPLCLLIADRLFRSGYTAAALLAFLLLGRLFGSGPDHVIGYEWACTLVFWPYTITSIRGLARQPRRPDWFLPSLAVALVLAEFAWCVFRVVAMFRGLSTQLQVYDASTVANVLLLNVGVIPWMLLFFAAITGLPRRPGSLRSLGLAGFAVFLLVQTAFFSIPNVPSVRENGTHYLRDLLFARDFIRQQPMSAGKTPTIYAPFGRVELVWLDMRMTSYFDMCQTAGVIFRRETAVEGQRRALVVRPFEVDYNRPADRSATDVFRRQLDRLFQGKLEASEPTVDDLARLCREPDLDYAVLTRKIGNLHAATNGQVYIYDCRQVRAALGRPPHGAGLANAQARRTDAQNAVE